MGKGVAVGIRVAVVTGTDVATGVQSARSVEQVASTAASTVALTSTVGSWTAPDEPLEQATLNPRETSTKAAKRISVIIHVDHQSAKAIQSRHLHVVA